MEMHILLNEVSIKRRLIKGEARRFSANSARLLSCESSSKIPRPLVQLLAITVH
jgi:hypothetical protein